MQVPLEITYHGVDKSDELDRLIRRKVDHLEHVNDRLTSCHVTVEKPHQHHRSGSDWRVRVSLNIPPRVELAVSETGEDAYQAVHLAFDKATRRLRKMTEKRRDDEHTQPDALAAG